MAGEDEKYMRRALKLAARAMGRTSPNPVVGALVVKEGEVVGSGYHRRAGTPHAEIWALEEAGTRARGATLYVTLEPCCHFGRTGPCTEAILACGIKRVVAAMADPNPLVAGQGLARLRESGVEVACGVLEEEALRQNEVFIKYITTGLPFVVLKVAASLDGKIATCTGDARWITGERARNLGHHLRDRYDAIMVGVETVLADDPMLTARLTRGGRDPVRIVLDSMARTPPGSRVLNRESGAALLIASTPGAPRERLRELERMGAEILTVAGSSQVDLKALLAELGRREITSVLVEGGPRVWTSFLREGLADKVVWFLAPLLIGGLKAPNAVLDLGVEKLSQALSLENVHLHRAGVDYCLEGYLK